MTAKIQKKIALGQHVAYTDAKGHTRVALVLGTPESIVEGTSLATLPADHYNVLTYTAGGRTSFKAAVPDANIANEDYLVDGELRQVVRPL
jgi:hypothetical protein